jgi:hypothetical protein
LIKQRYSNIIFDIFFIFVFTKNKGKYCPTSWWTLNLENHGADGVLVSFFGRMGQGYRRILRWIGKSFIVIPYLRLEMASRLDSSMTYSVGIGPLRKHFYVYMVLLIQMMLLL